jgi:hypothetical protein
VRGDIDIIVALNFLNWMLTSVHRWYRPNGRLNPDQIADEAIKMRSGFILSPPETPDAPSR